jgi:hypothetical protein
MAQPSPPAAPSQTQLLQDPQDHYELKKVLGRGSFGAVYVAVRKADNEEVAVKRLEVRCLKISCVVCVCFFVSFAMLFVSRRQRGLFLWTFFFFFFFFFFGGFFARALVTRCDLVDDAAHLDCIAYVQSYALLSTAHCLHPRWHSTSCRQRKAKKNLFFFFFFFVLLFVCVIFLNVSDSIVYKSISNL